MEENDQINTNDQVQIDVSAAECDFMLLMSEVMLDGRATHPVSYDEVTEPKEITALINKRREAMSRHLAKSKKESVDLDSGKSHEAHMACNAMILHILQEKLIAIQTASKNAVSVNKTSENT